MENTIVKIQSLNKLYGQLKALDDVTLNLPEGKVIGLLGPNGSGKTTLIKVLTNLLMRYEGSILIDAHEPGIETKKIISYLPDRNYLSDKWNAEDAIQYFDDFYQDFDAQKARSLVTKLGIDPLQSFKTLSKGTKEKLQLILVLSRNAKIYIFDEPIAGVDPAARDLIFNLINEYRAPGSTVIISTHLVSEVEEYLQYVVFLKSGKVLIDAPISFLTEQYKMSINDLFKEMYRYEILN